MICLTEETAGREYIVGYEYGKDGYLIREKLGDFVRSGAFVRRWTYKGKTCTLQLPGNRYVKRVEKFTEHWQDPQAFASFVEECTENGIARPSSYGDCFHSSFRSPKIRTSVNAIFRDAFRGAWEEAQQTGYLPGEWYHYDLTSAYKWASTTGLPVVATLRQARTITNLPGLYRVRLLEPVDGLPYPFNCQTEVNASTFEIDQYGLPIAHVYSGVTWTEVHAPDYFTRHMDRFTFAKQIGRSYWGRWASSSKIQCETHAKVWQLPNPIENLVWASLIISEVKRRVFEISDRAHVFVDSVLTRQKLPTGNQPGEWHLKGEYPEGIVVHGPGRYGPPGQLPDKYAGVPVNARSVLFH